MGLARFILPYQQASQKFHYINDIRQRSVADGLRQDMREWCIARGLKQGRDWDYALNTNQGGIEFFFKKRGPAAVFLLRFQDLPSVYQDEPVPRPEY